MPDSSREINGWTAPHLTPHWSSSLWVWDPPYGPSCFKISDDDGLGRTLSEVCPPVLYIPLHARDLILLTPGLLYALWHSLKKKKPYYDPTCKCFEWRELKDAKKFLPQILNPHQTVEMPAWQQTLWTWWNSASVWHYFISCLLFKISIFKILHGNTLLWFRHLKDVKVRSDIRMIKRYLPPHPCPPNSLTPWVPLY